MDFIANIFKLVVENKRFPSYQAERRIDIFINFFLDKILEAHYPGSKVTFIAPEFPLKKPENYQSTNVDYLCLRQEGSFRELIFVELKTDPESFSPKQYEIYKSFTSWDQCVEGLNQIIAKGKMGFNDRLKYFRLVQVLLNNELVQTKSGHSEIILTGQFGRRAEKSQFSRSFFGFMKDLEYPKLETRILYLAPGELIDNPKWNGSTDELLAFEEISKTNFKDYYSNDWDLIKSTLLTNTEET